uniref:Uncharacterized protein n=1 Tax=uncultured marine virus TaxID=186617 RepID=A0A0F7L0F2_9VIRU|nr:hypothetical protein [uncultured marine virus]
MPPLAFQSPDMVPKSFPCSARSRPAPTCPTRPKRLRRPLRREWRQRESSEDGSCRIP